MPSDRILLATDFSPGAATAAQAARLLARSAEDVVVLHAARVPHAPAEGIGQPPATLGPALSRPVAPDVARVRQELSAWCDAHGLEEAERVVAAGEPDVEIVRHATALDPWMVAVGATGSGRVARALAGTTATRVAHEAPCDVLVARPRAGADAGAEPFAIRRILLATDFSPHAEAAAAEAKRVAARCGAEILLLHVRDRSIAGVAIDVGEAEPRLAEFRDRHLGGDARILLKEGAPAAAVREAAEEHGADLVVAGNRGTSNLPRVLLGSVARSILERAPCSVLLTRRDAGIP